MRKNANLLLALCLSTAFTACATSSSKPGSLGGKTQEPPSEFRKPAKGAVGRVVDSGQFVADSAAGVDNYFYSCHRNAGGNNGKWEIVVMAIESDTAPHLIKRLELNLTLSDADYIFVTGAKGSANHWVVWTAVKFD